MFTGKWQIRDHDAERNLFKRRLRVAGALVLALFALLVFKLVDLQVYQYEHFSARADGNRLHSQRIPPLRGQIFDRAGRLIADSQPIHNLTVVRERVPDMDASLDLLSRLIGLTDGEIAQFRNRSRRDRVPFSSIPVKFVLSERESARVAVNSHRLPGFTIEAQFVRHYPLGGLMAHAVGYVSEINREELRGMDKVQRENYGSSNHIGKTGVERTYEHLLHGTVGYETVEKNSLGQVMRRLGRNDPVAGHDLTLHIHAELQQVVQRALGGRRGAVVAIEPATGGILAMLSKPDFDPNLFVTGISDAEYDSLVNDSGINAPLFDRSTNPFPPASTVKPFLALAGLNLNFVDYETTIEDPGYFQLPGVSRRWHDWTFRTDRSGGHGTIDLRRAIYQSCDTFFYDMGVRMGIENMHGFLSLFGFGANHALDVEAHIGVLPSEQWKLETRGEHWFPGDTVNASIGQGLTSVTPLQLATAVAILANKGRVVQPRLLKAVDGETDDHRLPAPTEENLLPDVVLEDPDYWRFIEQAMIDVVHRPLGRIRDYGGAYEFTALLDEDMPYLMASKTGTAQVVSIDQEITHADDIQVADEHQDHALFITYAPARNPHIPPQIALAVLVENGGMGASVAGPIAKRIVDAYLLDILDIDFNNPETEQAPKLSSSR